jgi:hypothetical protein
MIKVIILNSLREEIYKTFKKESLNIYRLLDELETNPQKGKVLGHIGNMSIRELKYRNFRFYFIVDGYKLYLFGRKEISELLIRFVRMSDKKHQSQTIAEIRTILIKIGLEGF